MSYHLLTEVEVEVDPNPDALFYTGKRLKNVGNFRSIYTYYIMHDLRHTRKTHANLFNRLSFSPFASSNSFRAFSASVQRKTTHCYMNYCLASEEKYSIDYRVKTIKNCKKYK